MGVDRFGEVQRSVRALISLAVSMESGPAIIGLQTYQSTKFDMVIQKMSQKEKSKQSSIWQVNAPIFSHAKSRTFRALSCTRPDLINTTFFAIGQFPKLAFTIGMVSIRHLLSSSRASRGHCLLRSCTQPFSNSSKCATRKRAFTQDEDDFIIDRRQAGTPYADISSALNRPISSVRTRGFRLGPERPICPSSDLARGKELEPLRLAGKRWKDIAIETGQLEGSLRAVYSRYRLLKKLDDQELTALREAAYRSFTIEEDEELVKMRKSGMDWVQISLAMKRSPTSCRGRYYRTLLRNIRETTSQPHTDATQKQSISPRKTTEAQSSPSERSPFDS